MGSSTFDESPCVMSKNGICLIIFYNFHVVFTDVQLQIKRNILCTIDAFNCGVSQY